MCGERVGGDAWFNGHHTPEDGLGKREVEGWSKKMPTHGSLRCPAGVVSYDVPTFTKHTKCCTFIKVEDSRETDRQNRSSRG